MPCWLWVVLFTVLLLSSGAYSAKDTPRSEESNCRYDLTSIAALSCVQPNGAWRPLSRTCCNALLYAIDQVPASDVSGACCLCRYMKEKSGPPELATAYAICNGKDRHIVAKWLFPFEKCIVECGEENSSSLGVDPDVIECRPEGCPEVQAHDTAKGQAHGTANGIWVAAVVFMMIGLTCFWFYRRCRVAKNASESRAERRRSVGPSAAKGKERRFSSS